MVKLKRKPSMLPLFETLLWLVRFPPGCAIEVHIDCKSMLTRICQINKCTYFQYKYAIRLVILKLLYQNIFVFSAISCCLKIFRYLRLELPN